MSLVLTSSIKQEHAVRRCLAHTLDHHCIMFRSFELTNHVLKTANSNDGLVRKVHVISRCSQQLFWLKRSGAPHGFVAWSWPNCWGMHSLRHKLLAQLQQPRQLTTQRLMLECLAHFGKPELIIRLSFWVLGAGMSWVNTKRYWPSGTPGSWWQPHNCANYNWTFQPNSSMLMLGIAGVSSYSTVVNTFFILFLGPHIDCCTSPSGKDKTKLKEEFRFHTMRRVSCWRCVVALNIITNLYQHMLSSKVRGSHSLSHQFLSPTCFRWSNKAISSFKHTAASKRNMLETKPGAWSLVTFRKIHGIQCIYDKIWYINN